MINWAGTGSPGLGLACNWSEIATIGAPCSEGLDPGDKFLFIVICFENSPDNVDSEM